eukprot:TRINITY_DN20953_c0_g1_i1.p1 TRINITY_DN20953_c0_g1~~TRINITY_DN20953_c0_g1_i1.p1  ORF type:complete len:199 (+),score=14.18 TRINITY_DN20953_c0_g1_i1:22-597(+)
MGFHRDEYTKDGFLGEGSGEQKQRERQWGGRDLRLLSSSTLDRPAGSGLGVLGPLGTLNGGIFLDVNGKAGLHVHPNSVRDEVGIRQGVEARNGVVRPLADENASTIERHDGPEAERLREETVDPNLPKSADAMDEAGGPETGATLKRPVERGKRPSDVSHNKENFSGNFSYARSSATCDFREGAEAGQVG